MGPNSNGRTLPAMGVQNSKLRIIKIGPVQLELEPSDYSLVKEWYYSETMHPIRFGRFCRLVVRAYNQQLIFGGTQQQ